MNAISPDNIAERLIKVDEVACYCSVSSKTVRRWIHEGKLIAHRLGAQLRISPVDLAQFINERRNILRSPMGDSAV
jgi:excisionase family DNA binding protein